LKKPIKPKNLPVWTFSKKNRVFLNLIAVDKIEFQIWHLPSLNKLMCVTGQAAIDLFVLKYGCWVT